MPLIRPFAALLTTLAATVALAQDRPLPLEDVLKEKAGHLRVSSAWISGGIFDLSFPTTARESTPAIRAYSGSAGMSLDYTYLGSRTSGWANYSGDYSLASIAALDSLSHYAQGGVLRRLSPRFSLGLLGSFQQLNLGARLFRGSRQSQSLQSPGFGVANSGGLGGSVDPVGETINSIPGAGTFGLTLGGDQRTYTVGLSSGYLFSPRTNLQMSASVSQSDFLNTPGVNVQLPFTSSRSGYGVVQLRRQATQRVSLNVQVQGGQVRAQGERLNNITTSFGVGVRLSPNWQFDASGGGGATSVFQTGTVVPWVFQYTDLVRLTYATRRQAFLVSFSEDAGDQLALGFQRTSQLSVFWNLRPPTSGWALSLRAGGARLSTSSQPGFNAGTLQAGISRHLFGEVYLLGEAAYVTNVLFAQQRLLAQGSSGSTVDSVSQDGIRLSVVYRPGPDRK